MKVEVKTYKLGDYKPDGSLDYKLHLLERKEFESDVAEKMLLEIAVAGESNLSPEHYAGKVILAMTDFALDEARCLYNLKFVNSLCDLVVIELCDPRGYVLVIGCRFGPMNVIYRRKDINYDDMLTFKDIKRAVLAWDNFKWYDPRKPDPRLEESMLHEQDF